MQLEVLGNCGGSPAAAGACSGYLVQEESTTVLLDCGPGITGSLQRNHACWDLDAVFITHLHHDHCLDLLPLGFRLMSLSRHGDGPPEPPKRIPLFLPPGGAKVFQQLRDVFRDNACGVVFDVYERTGGDSLEVGSLKLSCLDMEHTVTCQGVRLRSGERVLAYSGDSRFHDGLVDLAQKADFFLCEASGRRPEERLVKQGAHLTAAQAGTAAREGKAARLVLTHFSQQEAGWPAMPRRSSARV